MNVMVTTVFPEGCTRVEVPLSRLERQLKHEGIELDGVMLVGLQMGIKIVVEQWDMVIEATEV